MWVVEYYSGPGPRPEWVVTMVTMVVVLGLVAAVLGVLAML
jgi:hypothetical protein